MIPISGGYEPNAEFRAFVRLRQAIKDLRAADRDARRRTPSKADVHAIAFDLLNLGAGPDREDPLAAHLVDLLVDKGFDRQATRLVVKRLMDEPFLRD